MCFVAFVQFGFRRFVRVVSVLRRLLGQNMLLRLRNVLFVEQPGRYQLLSVAKKVYSSSNKQDYCKQLAETLMSVRARKFGNSHIFTVNIVTTSSLAVTLNYPAGAPSAVTGHVANNHYVSLPSHSHITFTQSTRHTPSKLRNLIFDHYKCL